MVNLVHLVYGPSKSGTTSIYQALTENEIFPVLQVHGEFAEVGIHDGLINSQFTKFVKEHFADIIHEVDENTEIHCSNSSSFKSYVVYIKNNHQVRLRFFKLLCQWPLKIIMPLRDPFMRSVSAMLHWLDMDTISDMYTAIFDKPLDLNNLQKEEISQLIHYPIEQCLLRIKEKGKISLEDVCKIYLDVFKEDLFREYIAVYFNLRTFFGFNVCLQNKTYYETHNLSNNWHFFTFRLEDLKNIMEELYDFLGLPDDYAFPHARNKYERKHYIVDESVDDIITALKSVWKDIDVPAIVCQMPL